MIIQTNNEMTLNKKIWKLNKLSNGNKGTKYINTHIYVRQILAGEEIHPYNYNEYEVPLVKLLFIKLYS